MRDDGRRDAAETSAGGSAGGPAMRLGRPAVLAAAAVVALGGWAWGAWEHFVAVPQASETARIAHALQLVDRFDETAGYRAYVELANDMKPWWTAIEETQRRIQAAANDEERDRLIGERDASLIAFVEKQGLTAKVTAVVGSFDTFARCLAATACDEGVVERAIAVDVKRIWRTFRPWILDRRARAGDGDPALGRELEGLYFRFVG